MTGQKQKKVQEAAAKLNRPRPLELPSGKWRCQIMVGGQRIDVIEDDPTVAHAKSLAVKAGLLEQSQSRSASPSLADAIDIYIAEKENVLSPATIRRYDGVKKLITY